LTVEICQIIQRVITPRLRSNAVGEGVAVDSGNGEGNPEERVTEKKRRVKADAEPDK
jgi:hypothetical protein